MNSSPEKLRVAVAGTSFGGSTQIPVFQTHSRTQVTAVSSGRAERAAEAAQQFGIPEHYTDFEQMLDEAKPDIVSIATPPEFHFPMTMAALRRGIHVLCEKPFALNADAAREMKTAADSKGVVAMIDFEFRFMPSTAYGLHLIRNNHIGEVRMVEFSCHFGLRARADDLPWDWWSDESRGGGVLGAVGSHAIDLLRQIGGPVRTVFAQLKTFVSQRSSREVTSDDSCALTIEYQSGALATVQLSAAAGATDGRVHVYGSEGQVVIPNIWGMELRVAKRDERTLSIVDIPAEFQVSPEQPSLRAPFRVLVGRMVHAIDGNLPSPSPNFEDAVAAQVALDAARLSHRQNKPVLLKPWPVKRGF